MTDRQGWEPPPQHPGQGYGQQHPQDGPWQPQQYDPGQHQRRMYGSQPQQQYPPQPGYGYGQPTWPPQDQQWGQPGYGQQPPYPPQSPVPPQPQGPRRKRHTARNVIAGLGALVVVIIVIIVANSGGHTISTTGTSGSTAGGSKSAPKTAGIGSAITLSGNTSGEQMAVTVTKVITSAQPGDEFSSAPAGDRLYAVQFRLRDTGSAAYSDSPSNGAAVVDSAGQSYQSALDNAAGCPSFPGSENIAPGASGLGCIVFEVPKAAKITEVQFTLDSGMGPQTGQWNVG